MASLINALTSIGIAIEGLTWWFHVTSVESISELGYGGPRSQHYSGWYSELGHFDDMLPPDEFSHADSSNVHQVARSLNGRWAQIIESKTIVHPNGRTLEYKTDVELTPAFWLRVPERWNR